MKTNPALLGYF